MMLIKFAFAALMALSISTAAQAAEPVTGVWIVKGKVSGFAFSLWCDLVQTGQTLTGECRDNGPKGTAHKLTSGYVRGDKVRFVYQSNYLVTKFDAAYEGVLSGDTIIGQALAGGRTGPMSATRAEP